MGLDMYLMKARKVFRDGQKVDIASLYPDSLKEDDEGLCEFLKPYETRSQYGFASYTDEVGYWRKTNQIHNWFVNNVQDGEDDCRTTLVEKEELQELLDTCKKVRDGGINTKLAFLPRATGFFFGSGEYDELYDEQIKNTISILEKVLENTDWDLEEIYYSSSW